MVRIGRGLGVSRDKAKGSLIYVPYMAEVPALCYVQCPWDTVKVTGGDTYHDNLSSLDVLSVSTQKSLYHYSLLCPSYSPCAHSQCSQVAEHGACAWHRRLARRDGSTRHVRR